MKKIVIIIVIAAVAIGGVVAYKKYSKKPSPTATTTVSTQSTTPTTPSVTPTPAPATTPTVTPKPVSTPLHVEPIDQFKQRITKKFFGTYVTPQSSPVQPERFTGYHTGVDVEYGDVTSDVPVRVIADGVVQRSGWVSGYGGMVAISHTVNGKRLFSLYGHLRPSSLPSVGAHVTQGQQIGVLGTAYSNETDGERRHLHFAIITSSTLTVKGYVANKSDLSTSWIDPLSLYP